MSKYFFLFTALIVTTLAAAEEYRYFIVPPSWDDVALDEMPDSVKRCSINKKHRPLSPTINVTSETTKLSIKEYLRASKKLIENSRYATVSTLGTIVTEAGPAHLSIIEAMNTCGTIRSMQATIIREGIAYNITTSALKKEFPLFYDDFFVALKSFTISK